jgi:hypothetical protein
MRILWEHAPADGSISVMDVPCHGMLYLTDKARRGPCPTCVHTAWLDNGGGGKKLRWMAHGVGKVCFYPQLFYLPPELEPLGIGQERRVRTFLTKAVQLLKHSTGHLFVWWRIEEVTNDLCVQRVGNQENPVPKGKYLLLSPYWCPPGASLDWTLSCPPEPTYPRRIASVKS